MKTEDGHDAPKGTPQSLWKMKSKCQLKNLKSICTGVFRKFMEHEYYKTKEIKHISYKDSAPKATHLLLPFSGELSKPLYQPRNTTNGQQRARSWGEDRASPSRCQRERAPAYTTASHSGLSSWETRFPPSLWYSLQQAWYTQLPGITH